MARYVVTGGAGFIGSHLVDRLLADGHRVVAVDDLSTGSRANVEHLSGESRFEFIETDVSKEFPDVGEADGVLHFASPASPVDFVPRAIEILKVGSYGTFNGLEYARRRSAWFFMASTSEIYGDPEVNPQPEEYLGNVNSIGVRSVYDEAKRFSEALTMAYHRTHNVPTSIVRIFNTYGPRMRADDGRVIPNFISQALKGRPLTLYGDGSQTRSLCYVSDLVDGLLRFVKQRPLPPINLGNDNEMPVKSLAETILRLTGSKSGIEHQPLPEGDPKLRCPSIRRAKELLGWVPKVPLDDGLRRTIAYFETRI
ncbi:MAG: UDP-glucuronic acid decarboxylase family protein [Pseudomonadota bacterium]